MLRTVLARCTDLLFPPVCHLCKEFIPGAGEIKICGSCLKGLRYIRSPQCSCCGVPFPGACQGDHLCSNCLTSRPVFQCARAALFFEGGVRELIHQFKYGKRVVLRRPLGLLAAAALDGFVRDFGAEIILPVPLHVKRLRQRGFNQALLLAEVFAHRWRIPLFRDNLCRMRWTEPQVSLNAVQRAVNVKGAFALAAPGLVRQKRVLLVDDVYTTGSTVKECGRVLMREGAASVAVLTVARD